ncbi:MAG: hypothetical protein A2X64_00305 [Ignavibacteria bacterium GWF2_33_9]|nr:MAG: hypothetical protein A2X64_00305 [Ignavibacteria bacterium GWF2_33_9]
MNYFVIIIIITGEDMVQKCLNCGNNDIRVAEVSSTGSYGPDLLPGTGIFRHAKFQVGVCTTCGYTHFFVLSEDIEKVKKSKKFRGKFDLE